MPDNKSLGNGGRLTDDKLGQATRTLERKPAEIAHDLEGHRLELEDAVGDLKDEVIEKVAAGWRVIAFVPNAVKSAGAAGKRAGMRVGREVKARPIMAAVIGAGAIGLIAGAVVMTRRRNRSRLTAAAAKIKAPAASRKRKARR